MVAYVVAIRRNRQNKSRLHITRRMGRDSPTEDFEKLAFPRSLYPFQHFSTAGSLEDSGPMHGTSSPWLTSDLDQVLTLPSRPAVIEHTLPLWQGSRMPLNRGRGIHKTRCAGLRSNSTVRRRKFSSPACWSIDSFMLLHSKLSALPGGQSRFILSAEMFEMVINICCVDIQNFSRCNPPNPG